MVAQVVAAVEDAAGERGVVVQPAADREHGDPGPRLLRLAEQRLRRGGVALPVEGQRDLAPVARPVGDLRGQPGEPAGRGAGPRRPGRGGPVAPARGAGRTAVTAAARAPRGETTGQHRPRAGRAQAAAEPQDVPPPVLRLAVRAIAPRHMLRHADHLIRQYGESRRLTRLGHAAPLPRPHHAPPRPPGAPSHSRPNTLSAGLGSPGRPSAAEARPSFQALLIARESCCLTSVYQAGVPSHQGFTSKLCRSDLIFTVMPFWLAGSRLP